VDQLDFTPAWNDIPSCTDVVQTITRLLQSARRRRERSMTRTFICLGAILTSIFALPATAATCSGYYTACMKSSMGQSSSQRSRTGNVDLGARCAETRAACMKTGNWQTQYTSASGLDRR
jgi:hypothetical protein